MLIGSIDPAIKNVGLAVVCSNSKRIVHLGKYNMLTPECLDTGKSWDYSRSIIPRMCKQFIEDRIDILCKCDFIVIEGQMLSKFIQISLVLEALLLMICPTIIIHPTCIKRHYNISTGNYAKNKKASVDCCKRLLSTEDWKLVEIFPEKKRDDVSDAILQGLYAVDNIEILIKKFESLPKLEKTKVKKKRKRTAKDTTIKIKRKK